MDSKQADTAAAGNAPAGVRPYVAEDYITTVCPQCFAEAPRASSDPGVWLDGVLARHSGSIWLRRTCPVHGETESLYEEDAELWSARRGWAAPTQYTAPDRAGNAGGAPGCYRDGLPSSHGQHTCTLLLNITGSCSLGCPSCYAAATPGAGAGHAAPDEVLHTVEAVLEREGGRLGVLMLSGGEPAEHPRLAELLERLAPLPITRIMFNTNGLRLAGDESLVRLLAQNKHKLEAYLQFDGLEPETYLKLRGADLAGAKREALARLSAAGIAVTLVPAIARGVSEHELGALVRLGLATPHCAGLAIQPLFTSGRSLPLDPRARTTPTGVMRLLEAQCGGLLTAADFIPLPCPGRDCCDITYLLHTGRRWEALPRLTGREQLKRWLHLAANTMTFEHLPQPLAGMLSGGALKRAFSEQLPGHGSELARDLLQLCACAPKLAGALKPRRAPRGGAAAELPRVFRITIKMFMDPHRFVASRLRQCCVHVGTYEDDPRRYPFCWRWLFCDAQDYPSAGAP